MPKRRGVIYKFMVRECFEWSNSNPNSTRCEKALLIQPFADGRGVPAFFAVIAIVILFVCVFFRTGKLVVRVPCR